MIKERGRIVAIKGSKIWIEVDRDPGCKTCASGAGCGQGLLARMSQRRANYLELETQEPVSVGDLVLIGIAENKLVGSSVWAYVVPLLGMLTAVVIAEQILQMAEPMVILAGLLGLGCGIALTRLNSTRAGFREAYQPVVLELCNASEPSVSYHSALNADSTSEGALKG